MSGFDEVASAFIQHYYATSDSNPAALQSLYQPQSTLTFEGAQVQGPEAIVQKLMSTGGVTHNIAGLTKDVQASPGGQAMLIFVQGQLVIAGQSNPLNFSQVFQLVATGPGQFYIHNEFFRLIYN